MQKIDIVIPFGDGSENGDLELKYCLRSIEKHVKNYGTIFIIGKDPNFTNPLHVKVVPMEDVFRNPARNIMSKIYKACRILEVSDNFLMFNDDFFVVKDINAETYPFYYENTLDHPRVFGDYTPHVKATTQALLSKNLPIKDFDLHKPIIFNKTSFLEVMDQYTWDRPHGLILKSLYCNTLGKVGEPTQDAKLRYQFGEDYIKNFIAKTDVFSVADAAITPELIKVLEELYPEKSKFEK